MVEEKKLLTIKEVSGLIGISESEVIRMIMLKKLPVVRLGKAIRISEDELDEFLKGFLARGEIRTGYSEPVLYTAEQVAKILMLSFDNIWNLLFSGGL